jgi:hypothetical protein
MPFKTPHELWLHKKALQEKRRANWTPEQWEEYRAKRRQICNNWYHKAEQEGHPLHVVHQERRKQKWDSLTEEEKFERTKYYRKYREDFTTQALEKERARGRSYQRKLKIEIVTHYSNGSMKCMNPNCQVPGGASDILCLCIDHINGGGNIHTKELKENGTNLYQWLKKQKFPAGFQVLCANCNMIKKVSNKEDYRGTQFKRVYRRKAKENKEKS